MTWSLEEVTQAISCNLCEQEFGDLQPYYAHARLTHLPFPASTIRGSRHAQPLRQPRRNRQHARNGHEREARVHQEGRQLGRRGAATPTTAPTYRSRTKRYGGSNGSTTVVAKPRTRSNRCRLQVRTSTAHAHGTRVSGRSAGDVMVKAFLDGRGVQAKSKAWHNAMQSEHFRSAWQPLTHKDQTEGRAKDTRARDGVTQVFEQMDGSISQLVGSARLGFTGEPWPVSRT